MHSASLVCLSGAWYRREEERHRGCTVVSKNQLIVAAASLAASGAVSAQTTVIDFEGLPTDVALTDEFTGAGVVFAGGCFPDDQTFGGVLIVPSGDFWLHPGRLDCSATFVEPGSAAVAGTVEFVELSNAGLVSSAGYFAGASIEASNLAGDVIATVDVPQVGPSVGRPVSVVRIEVPGIHRIVIHNIEHDVFGGGALPFDLFTYGAVTVSCRADLDGDGTLTIFDFLAFQNLFDAGDPSADFDGDGSLTIFDFLAFQNAFDAGCP
ncbi:MAG: GC-type dockerin domain-anchored protein [Phycisphaerales bacterium JB064]